MRELLKKVPLGQPLVMLNQLKYRLTALYLDTPTATSITGREAYKRYSDLVAPCLAEVGSALLWRGAGLGMMIGPEDEVWHSVLLVKYPLRLSLCDNIDII